MKNRIISCNLLVNVNCDVIGAWGLVPSYDEILISVSELPLELRCMMEDATKTLQSKSVKRGPGLSLLRLQSWRKLAKRSMRKLVCNVINSE